jgi:hypothetical protein
MDEDTSMELNVKWFVLLAQDNKSVLKILQTSQRLY